jgi:CheY-like chemotaxis protein
MTKQEQNLVILVVDNSFPVRKLIIENLSKQGVETIEAVDATDAIRILGELPGLMMSGVLMKVRKLVSNSDLKFETIAKLYQHIRPYLQKSCLWLTVSITRGVPQTPLSFQ